MLVDCVRVAHSFFLEILERSMTLTRLINAMGHALVVAGLAGSAGLLLRALFLPRGLMGRVVISAS